MLLPHGRGGSRTAPTFLPMTRQWYITALGEPPIQPLMVSLSNHKLMMSGKGQLTCVDTPPAPTLELPAHPALEDADVH